MARQLIYTSAPRLLEAGRTGFGTVARNRDLTPMLVQTLERASQFSRQAGLDRQRLVYTHRIVPDGATRCHVISCIRDAGTDYTGRTNHIAHHLVIDQGEAALLMALGVTPADVATQFAWLPRWDDSPKQLAENIDLRSIDPSNPSHAYAWIRTSGDPAHRALLTQPETSRGCYLLLDPARSAPALELFREAMATEPRESWSTTFTSDLQPGEDAFDYQWRALPTNSPLAGSAHDSRLPVYDVSNPTSLPRLKAPLSRDTPSPSHGTAGARVRQSAPDSENANTEFEPPSEPVFATAPEPTSPTRSVPQFHLKEREPKSRNYELTQTPLQAHATSPKRRLPRWLLPAVAAVIVLLGVGMWTLTPLVIKSSKESQTVEPLEAQQLPSGTPDSQKLIRSASEAIKAIPKLSDEERRDLESRYRESLTIWTRPPTTLDSNDLSKAADRADSLASELRDKWPRTATKQEDELRRMAGEYRFFAAGLTYLKKPTQKQPERSLTKAVALPDETGLKSNFGQNGGTAILEWLSSLSRDDLKQSVNRNAFDDCIEFLSNEGAQDELKNLRKISGYWKDLANAITTPQSDKVMANDRLDGIKKDFLFHFKSLSNFVQLIESEKTKLQPPETPVSSLAASSNTPKATILHLDSDRSLYLESQPSKFRLKHEDGTVQTYEQAAGDLNKYAITRTGIAVYEWARPDNSGTTKLTLSAIENNPWKPWSILAIEGGPDVYFIPDPKPFTKQTALDYVVSYISQTATATVEVKDKEKAAFLRNANVKLALWVGSACYPLESDQASGNRWNASLKSIRNKATTLKDEIGSIDEELTKLKQKTETQLKAGDAISKDDALTSNIDPSVAYTILLNGTKRPGSNGAIPTETRTFNGQPKSMFNAITKALQDFRSDWDKDWFSLGMSKSDSFYPKKLSDDANANGELAAHLRAISLLSHDITPERLKNTYRSDMPNRENYISAVQKFFDNCGTLADKLRPEAGKTAPSPTPAESKDEEGEKRKRQISALEVKRREANIEFQLVAWSLDDKPIPESFLKSTGRTQANPSDLFFTSSKDQTLNCLSVEAPGTASR